MSDKLTEAVDAWTERIATADAPIQAFVDEPDRRQRLRQAVGRVRSQWLATAHRPPLWGTLVAVKDVLHVDGLPTRAGSTLPPQELAGRQASVVTALQAAGALVAGKTVTAEFALAAPGPTRNPHDLDHTPGGSSSGSAAAVAAGFTPLALGTQTVGSIIRPAAYCGVLGFKPGFGRISADGVVANAPSLDTVGVFAADLDHLRRAAEVILDDWAPVSPAGLPVIGIPRGPYLSQASSVGRRKFERQVDCLRANGYRVLDVPMFGDIAAVNRRHRVVNDFEFAFTHRAWFAAYPEAYRWESAEAIRRGSLVPVSQYHDACDGMAQFSAELGEIMAAAGVDLWATPAATGPAPIGLRGTGDPVMNLPWTQAGAPALSIPAGTADNGLPLGVQCCTAPGKDEYLLAWAPGLVAALSQLS